MNVRTSVADTERLPDEVETKLLKLAEPFFCDLARPECHELIENFYAAYRMGADRLKLAEAKLSEQGIRWDGDKYAFDGRD